MTPQLVKALDALKREFVAEIASGDIRHLGITNCRTKNNKKGAPWSEHSWPNAVDVMIRNWSGRKALGDRIAKWMRANPGLWSEVFWQVQAHFDHVHGTANPRKNFDNKQIPPCAGGKDDEDMEVVKQIQEALNAAGVTPKLVVDGIWGPKTQAGFITGLKLGPAPAAHDHDGRYVQDVSVTK